MSSCKGLFNYRCVHDSEEDKSAGLSCRNCGFVERTNGNYICDIQRELWGPLTYTTHIDVCDAWIPKVKDVMLHLIVENITLRKKLLEQSKIDCHKNTI